MTEHQSPHADQVTEAIRKVSDTMRMHNIAGSAGAAVVHHKANVVAKNKKPESPSDVDFSKRPSFMGEYAFDENGYPINPMDPEGIPGQGKMRRLGPCPAGDPIPIAIDPKTGKKKLLLIRRRDTGEWAFAGGNGEEGESAYQTVVRELFEETGVNLDGMPSEVVYEGYVPDPRNTRNAWYETSAHLFRLDHTPEARGNDDALEARWFNCNTMDELRQEIRELDNLDPSAKAMYASQEDTIEKALDLL